VGRDSYYSLDKVRNVEVLNVGHTFGKMLLVEYRFIGEERYAKANE